MPTNNLFPIEFVKCRTALNIGCYIILLKETNVYTTESATDFDWNFDRKNLIFWPKKPHILTEFAYFDRNCDRVQSVGKTFVEILLWPIGQKIVTEILTDWQSVKIFDRNFDRKLVKIRFDRHFDRKFRSKLVVLTEFWPTIWSKKPAIIPCQDMWREKLWPKSAKICWSK